jgi:hypothetical protein
MALYSVLVPFAGHIRVEVEADSEKAAIEAAMNSEDLNLDNVQDWEAFESLNDGNVCFCPQPWDVEATVEDE